MSIRKLSEQGALVASKAASNVFPVRILTEGKGSSGVYSRELLQEYANAFAGSPSYMNHPKNPDKPSERDVTTIAGRIVSEVAYKVVDDTAGLYADLKVDSRWVEFVEEYADVIGLSIYIEGDGHEDPSGEYIVESFNGDDPYKSVDFVVAAGRGGRVERAMESFRVIESSTGSPAGVDGAATASVEAKRKEKQMEELKALIETLAKTVNDKFVALEAKVDSVVTLSEQATAATAAQVDAFTVADELSKAVAEAGLPEEGRKRVLEAVRDNGRTIVEAVASEKAYISSIIEKVKPAETVYSYGRTVESKGTSTGTFSLTKMAEVA